MYGTWQILRGAWAAVMIVYCVLAIVASRRLRGKEKELNHVILIVMAMLIAIRIAVRWAFGGQAYRLAVMIVGIAAGVAALIVAKMMITQKAHDQTEDGNGGDEGIRSLKLS